MTTPTPTEREALIEAEMAAYSDGDYIDRTSARDRLTRFAAALASNPSPAEPSDNDISYLIVAHELTDSAWPSQKKLTAFARDVLAAYGGATPTQGETAAVPAVVSEDDLAMAWNTVRAEARNVRSGSSASLGGLLTAVEDYGDRRAALATQGTAPQVSNDAVAAALAHGKKWRALDAPQVSDKVDAADFEQWWQAHGQFGRAGGGDYEKTFAFNAWHAAIAATGARP